MFDENKSQLCFIIEVSETNQCSKATDDFSEKIVNASGIYPKLIDFGTPMTTNHFLKCSYLSDEDNS
jgi:hypothetical protein